MPPGLSGLSRLPHTFVTAECISPVGGHGLPLGILLASCVPDAVRPSRDAREHSAIAPVLFAAGFRVVRWAVAVFDVEQDSARQPVSVVISRAVRKRITLRRSLRCRVKQPVAATREDPALRTLLIAGVKPLRLGSVAYHARQIQFGAFPGPSLDGELAWLGIDGAIKPGRLLDRRRIHIFKKAQRIRSAGGQSLPIRILQLLCVLNPVSPSGNTRESETE